MGGPHMAPHYAAAWRGLAIPIQMGKQVASHLGGIVPMVIAWPKRIRTIGGLRSQFTHCTDTHRLSWKLLVCPSDGRERASPQIADARR